MKNSLIKKIILVTVCIISCLGLTGCGETIQQYATVHIPEAIQSRAARNIEIATEFYEIGALSTTQYEKCKKEIQKQADRYTDGADAEAMLDSLAKSVTQMHTAGIQDGKLFPFYLSFIADDDTSPKVLQPNKGWTYWGYLNPEEDKLDKPYVYNNNEKKNDKDGDSKAYTVMSNYLAKEVLRSKLSDDLSETDSQNIKIEDPISPIVFIDNSIMDSLNNMVKMEVYVLKPEITTNSGVNELDGIIEMIQAVTQQSGSSGVLNKISNIISGTSNDQADWNAKVNYLNNYFSPALDADGNPITLIDSEDDSFNIVKVSEPNESGEYKLGLDMWLAQDDIEDCLRVRFQEFNEDAVTRLKEYIGDHKFYIVPDGDGSWKAYLMEYPIDTINTMSLCTRSDDWAKDSGGYENVEVGLKRSGLGINLMTGQFVKYKYENNKFDWTTAQTIDIGSNEYYLTTSGAQNNDTTGLSSLVVKGVSEVSFKNSKDKTITLNCGRIILRDYLEATYAPDYNASDNGKNVVVFGRKIRFNMDNSNFFKDTSDVKKIASTSIEQDVLIYERGQTIANFVDVYGEAIPSSPTLEITDFCDYSDLTNSDPNQCMVSRLPYKNEEDFTTTREVTSEVPDITELSVSNEHKTIIKPITWFPSPDIGVTDYNSDTKQKQRFYCVVTTKGMFGSALYSSWIESTVPDANLDWWNEYLQSNGFSYNVDRVDVARYLSDNYRYQLSQSGVVILDLETVEKIQEMYDEEADSKRVGAIRTAFVFIGWVLVVGSFVLMLLWVFDTNTDLGFGLLEKVTLGNWVAVKYAEDIPTHNVNDQKYVCFKDICIRTMILIAIGILLIRIDIFYILTVLIDVFGNIASQLEKLIKGRIG